MKVIPDSLIKFVSIWEVRVLIVISLTLQIILISLGNRRKYVCKIWIGITLWSAYLLADWIAIVGLGMISKNTLDECKKGTDVDNPANQMMWFWAQFFLLHLGGPDTITAYSLEDNELWLRHLVGLLIQTGVTFYVLLVALPGSSWLPILCVLVFIAGLVKCGERIVALMSANSENFCDSLLTEPNSGPNYARFMEEFNLKKAEGFSVEAAQVIEIPVPAHHSFPDDTGKLIPEAYDLYLTFKRLFADLILSFQDRDSCHSYFQKLLPEQAFDVVEVELGFLFDELYTKSSLVHKRVGFFVLRLITFAFTLFALVGFVFLCDKGGYRKLDLGITYLLLVVAVCLEIYSWIVTANSDWTDNWLSRRKTTGISRIIRWFQNPEKKRRWSKKMAQHNLLDLCVRDNSTISFRIHKLLWGTCKFLKIHSYLEKHLHKTFVDVYPELKSLIFNELNTYTSNTIDNSFGPTVLWNQGGSFTLKEYGRLLPDWTTEEGEFDQRVILWHIATDICYTMERGGECDDDDPEIKSILEHSKHMSNYMLYLLVACPFMLPTGIGMMRFRDTCAEAKEFFEERNLTCCKLRACKKLLQVNTEVLPSKVKGDRSKSLLFDACVLAKSLILIKEEKWKIISGIWVEMLANAATHCRGNNHGRQLRKGGEILSHVWLLMAHLGITEQLQISQGHARAKLIVK